MRNFLKLLLLLGLFLLQLAPVLAQKTSSALVEEPDEDEVAYYAQMNHIFEHVNLNQVSSGILSDYGFSFINFSNYGGLALNDSNKVDLQRWRYLYGAMQVAKVNTKYSLPALESVNQQISAAYEADKVNLVIGHFRYHRLKDNALTSNLMYVVGDQLYDTPGRSSSPYQSKEAFAVCPIYPVVQAGSVKFVFKQSLYFSNAGKTVTKLEIDWGTGWKTAQWNTAITASLSASSQNKVIKFRLTHSDGSKRLSHALLKVESAATAARYGNMAAMPFFPQVQLAGFQNVATTARSYQGASTGANITIAWGGDGSPVLDRPLIVLEGFDAWHILNPERPGSNYSYFTFLEDMDNSLIIGVAPFFDLNDALDDAGYDLIFVDWHDGATYIQRNAHLVELLIEWVNLNKPSGSTVQNVILGMSMGGLVGRYALRDMEIIGQNHQTHLFISFDSPQEGANIPIGYQAMIRHLARKKLITDQAPDIERANLVLDSPAAQQMLIYQVRYDCTNSVPLCDKVLQNVGNNLRFLLQNEFNNMGYPRNSRNIAVSNGSECGVRLDIDFNQVLLKLNGEGGNYQTDPLIYTIIIQASLFPGSLLGPVGVGIGFLLGTFVASSNNVKLDFEVRALPNVGAYPTEVYYGKIHIRKKILFLIPVYIRYTSEFLEAPVSIPYDNAPGGIADINEFAGSNLQQLIQASLPYANVVTFTNQFSFVPTVSSLDVQTINANNLTSVYTNGSSPANPSTFLNFKSQEQFVNNGQTIHNTIHTLFTARNARWIFNEIQEVALNTENCSANCQPASNATMSGNSSVCGNTNYSIPAYGGIATYNWTVSNTNALQIVSGQGTPSIQVRNIGSFNGNAKITATIQTNCGNIPISKTVLVNGFNGTGNISSLLFGTFGGNWTYNPGADEIFFANSTAPTTTYNWDISGADILSGQGTDQLSVRIWQISGTEPYYGFVRLTLGNECGQGNPVTASFTIQPGGPVMLSVNPNPANEELQVEVITEENQEDVSFPLRGLGGFSFRLYNAYGVLLDSFTKEEKRFSVNISTLEAGLYYLHLLYKGKRIAKKVVVER